MVILVVSEEDGSDTYYELKSTYIPLLERIHHRIFEFRSDGIHCRDKSIKMDKELNNFLSRLRHGRYTSDWSDISTRLLVNNMMEESSSICLRSEYSIIFAH